MANIYDSYLRSFLIPQHHNIQLKAQRRSNEAINIQKLQTTTYVHTLHKS